MLNHEQYINLNELVLAYKHGDKSAAEGICKYYEEYIWKYTNLIHGEATYVNDNNMKKFIALFTDKVNNKSVVNRFYKTVLLETIFKIKELFKQYSEYEIRHELICALLHMAKKYCDYERPSFHTYVQRCFHYEAFRRLQKLIKDPLARQNYTTFDDEILVNETISKQTELVFERSIAEIDRKASLNKSEFIEEEEEYISVYSDNCLNENWINGISCSEMFLILTSFERQLIIEHELYKKTDAQIGQENGLCRATINRKRLKAIDKLKEHMINNNMFDNKAT